MKSLSLFKIQTLVGVFLIFGVLNFANAQTQLQPSNVESCEKNWKSLGYTSGKECVAAATGGPSVSGGCDSDYNKVKEALNKFNSSCSKSKMGSTVECKSKAEDCQAEAEDEDIPMPDMFSSMMGGAAGMAKKCPMTTGKDAKDNIRDISKELKDAQKDARDKEKELLDKKKEAKESYAELNQELAELDKRKSEDAAALEKEQMEGKNQSRQSLNEIENGLQELNTQILNAQSKKAQSLAQKAQELAGLSDALLKLNCESEVRNAIAKAGKSKSGSTSNLIKAYGKQKKAAQESFSQCIEAMLAQRKGVIEKYNGIMTSLDDEINKSSLKIQQLENELKEQKAAAAQQESLFAKQKNDAETKYWADRKILMQKIIDLNDSMTEYTNQADKELSELKGEITKLSNRLALAEQQPTNNTETSDDAMAAASNYVNELTPFIKGSCCAKGASTKYDACEWKKDGTQKGGGADSSGGIK